MIWKEAALSSLFFLLNIVFPLFFCQIFRFFAAKLGELYFKVRKYEN